MAVGKDERQAQVGATPCSGLEPLEKGEVYGDGVLHGT